MNRNINQQQSPFKKSKISGNEIRLPTDERLEKMMFALPISFPSAMLPVRIPELYYKMKNRQYPNYFYFSILALGNRLCYKTTNDEEKILESQYENESLESLKQETDIRNPFYLWTCVILLARHGRGKNRSINNTVLTLASSSVRISKIYQLDLSRIVKMKYTEEELEFRRRVFWTFYSFDRLSMSFSGSFPTIQDRDIVVNLPKNDFLWRYGGECKLEHRELMFWNYIANNLDIHEHPKEKHEDLVKTIILQGKISLFARRRWITKFYDPDDDNLQLIRLINNLNKYNDNIVTPNRVNFEKIKEVHEKYENTLRMTIETEIQIFNYLFNQLHNSMKIVLYQTEMVRIKGRYMHPGRIVSAKNIITEYTEKQIDLLHNFDLVLPPNHSEFIVSPFTLLHNSMKIVLYQTEMVRIKGRYMHPGRIVSAKNIITEYTEKQIDLLHNFDLVLPPNHSEFIVSPFTLVSGVVCLNLMGINPSSRKFDVPLKLKMLTDEYKKMDDISRLFVVYPLYLNRLSNLIGEAHQENKKYSMIFDNMKKFSIDESDVNPWLVPKYATHFSILCCFGNSFSTLKINEYLDVDESTIAIYNEILNSRTEDNNSSVSSSQEYHYLPIGKSSTSDIPNSSTYTDTKESYKTNYELYNKYSQLLEKSAPNSIQGYFLNHMVEKYSSRIVNDILTNPVNNQSNPSVSFNTPSISYSFNIFGKRVESEDEENQWDL
ncbi:hypothetical protein BB558_003176 [Smittium angustum]|uniref:Xylanolytic transcriptional activator regulatory domain-containing protein n=1 Tax=Smittium angustum TaxID=133377 RepID=A0A2U1J6T2_SMIAN|nr:hypothetical protein BB558_003176 [Smittium angustum]